MRRDTLADGSVGSGSYGHSTRSGLNLASAPPECVPRWARVRAYSPETGQTAGYLTFADHDMNQKCRVIWVGDEADLECALEGLQRLGDDEPMCGYYAPSGDSSRTCDLEQCAGDFYP